MQSKNLAVVVLYLSAALTVGVPILSLTTDVTSVRMVSEHFPNEYNGTNVANVLRCDSGVLCPRIEMGTPPNILLMRAAETSAKDTYILFCPPHPFVCHKHNATIRVANTGNVRRGVYAHQAQINNALKTLGVMGHVVADADIANLWHPPSPLSGSHSSLSKFMDVL